MIVIDASVAAKAYIAEPGSDQAIETLTGPRKLFAPEILRTEVALAICARVSLNELTAAEALERVEHFERQLDEDWIHLVPTRELLALACRLATTLLLPVPGCLYLALAQAREIPLITADRTFFDQAKTAHSLTESLAGCS